MRGPGPNQGSPDLRARFIPACAGTSGRLVCPSRLKTVHPRVCGDQDAHQTKPSKSIGSSPRVRGPARLLWTLGLSSRFIPACAGTRKIAKMWDFSNSGSSPRVRGPGIKAADREERRRFIPACAGTRPVARSPRESLPVHPRVCGDQAPGDAIIWRRDGSSPRVRGPGRVNPSLAGRRRFIPACAGTSPQSRRAYADNTVHPRVCGDQARGPGASLRRGGSSPRVRGPG